MSLDPTAANSSPPITTSGWWGGVTSALFWLLLLTAAALYAGVALAPKIIQWQRWQQMYVAQRYQLVEQENQLEALSRMVDALDQDPQFVAELVRLELDATTAGEEVIPVDDSLTHDPRTMTVTTSRSLPPGAIDPWEPWLLVLSTHDSLRSSLLAAAATLVIAAFTFLHDGSETQRALRENQPDAGLTVWQFCRLRYCVPQVAIAEQTAIAGDQIDAQAVVIESLQPAASAE